MSITLYYHPFTRAAAVVTMLEELGVPYKLEFVDVRKSAHKDPDFLALNPMGKLPMLRDGDALITESAAIGMYLADRYAPGRLAPALEDPERATYLRWILYSPSVIEPACYAKNAGWAVRESAAGWGSYEAMLTTVEHAIGEGPWLLGDHFTMADVTFGSTIAYMLMFNLLEPRPTFLAYRDRVEARPAWKAAKAVNAAAIAEHGLA